MKHLVVTAAVLAAGHLALGTSPCADDLPPRTESTLVAAGAKVSATPVEAPQDACPDGMVEIEGEYCAAVEQLCVKLVEPKHPEKDRCEEFAPSGRCLVPTVHKHVCMDRYEFPNRAGVKPDLAMNWWEANDECKAIGKRLCTDTEWTLACEGEEHLPYPYGYVRNAGACNIDRPYILPDDNKWANLKTRPAEISRLDQRDPSGARESCVSPYGVYDMTGNVDEWVYNEDGHAKEKPYVSGLKGGYWGPVRDRCRPMTTDHNQWHTGYQIGFRCCADVPAEPLPKPPSSGESTGS